MGCSLGMGHGGLEHPCRRRDQGLCCLAIPSSCLVETPWPRCGKSRGTGWCCKGNGLGWVLFGVGAEGAACWGNASGG